VAPKDKYVAPDTYVPPAYTYVAPTTYTYVAPTNNYVAPEAQSSGVSSYTAQSSYSAPAKTYSAYTGRSSENATPYVAVARTSAYAYLPKTITTQETDTLAHAVESGDHTDEERIQEILLNGDPNEDSYK
jgi:hypothetical protein